MSRKSFSLIFLANLLIFIAGNGLLPLLPVYAVDLGMSASVTGVYLAGAYVALALGTFLGGRLARQDPRVPFAAAGAGAALVLLLLSSMTELWAVVALTAVLWFSGGLAATLLAIYVGQHAPAAQRGRLFARLYLALPLGAVIGGLGVARLVANVGYAGVFLALAILYAVLPFAGYFGLRPQPVASAVPNNPPGSKAPDRFLLLLTAAFLVGMAGFAGRMATSLLMHGAAFAPSAISLAAALGALFVLPVVPAAGMLSDRRGRRLLVTLSYLMVAAGMLLLLGANSIAYYVAAAVSFSLAAYVGAPLASALATDLLPGPLVARGLARLNAAGWASGVAGFALAGLLLQRFGPAALLVGGAGVAVLAAALLQGVREPRQSVDDGSEPAASVEPDGKKTLMMRKTM